MKINKILKIVMIFLVLFFFLLFLSEKLGYYEQQLGKKVTLTNEQIKKFEEDIKNGKSVDLEEYLEYQNKDYNNKVSNISLKVSSSIEEIFNSSIKYIFNKIADAINE